MLDIRFILGKSFLLVLWICHGLLAFVVFEEKSVVNVIGVFFYMMNHFYLATFKIFSLYLPFCIFIMKYLGMDLFFKIYLYMAMLGLYYCVWLSPVALSGSYCFAVASLCSSFSCCRAWALGMWASVVTAHGLRSCGLWALEHWLSSCGTWAFSCSMACGIFLNQGLNHCPHHWQADS